MHCVVVSLGKVRILKACVRDDSVHEKVSDNGGAEGGAWGLHFCVAAIFFFFLYFSRHISSSVLLHMRLYDV